MDEAARVSAAVGFDMDSGWVVLPKNDLGIDRLHRMAKIEGAELLTLDLLEADSLDNRLLADRERISLGERQVSVLSRDSLVEMKSRSERTKDRLSPSIIQKCRVSGCREPATPSNYG